MTTPSLDRVFGTSRLKMVTGQYVEVYREAAVPGERRRYTKRFVRTREGDFREWTEREWRILARLVGHGARHVPDIVQYDRGGGDGPAIVQTYDAGVTVDHWVTLLPVQRDGRRQRHVFQDCAHWWALARHLLLALHEIHALRLVHLDLKADNVCLPFSPDGFCPGSAQERIFPVFENLALIDFAFSLISGEAPMSPLPIGWQRAYPYQSPRLLKALVAGQNGDLGPTCLLDWRCDMYSLAALLKCYLPSQLEIGSPGTQRGWTPARYFAAKKLVQEIVQSHDRDAGSLLPHSGFAASCAAQLRSADLVTSLHHGWLLADVAARDDEMTLTAPMTPVTLIEPYPASAGVATEIFVRREAADPARGGLTTGRSGDGRAEAASPALATETGHPPVMASASVAESVATSLAASVAASVGTPAIESIGDPVARPAGSTSLDERLDARIFRRSRISAYGLSLLALVAVFMVWQGRHRLANDAGEPRAEAAGHRTEAVTVGPIAGAAGASTAAVMADPSHAESAAARAVESPAARVVESAAARGAESPATLAVESPATRGAAEVAVVSPPGASMASQRVASALQGVSAADPGGRADVPPTAIFGPGVGDDRYGKRADEIILKVVPPVVERASPRIAEVLSLAAKAHDAADDRRTREAAGSIVQAAAAVARPGAANHAGPGRQFNAAANAEFWQHGDVARAFQLQWRAFGANPDSTEIAGNLAFYALKMNPPQIETSRRLAIFALTATRATGLSRLEDWGNLAVASALSGRPEDAVNAMLVLMAVSKDVNRSCRSALSSVASFGPALKAPAQALLSRANARGEAVNARYCQWPPRWEAGAKFP